MRFPRPALTVLDLIRTAVRINKAKINGIIKFHVYNDNYASIRTAGSMVVGANVRCFQSVQRLIFPEYFYPWRRYIAFQTH